VVLEELLVVAWPVNGDVKQGALLNRDAVANLVIPLPVAQLRAFPPKFRSAGARLPLAHNGEQPRAGIADAECRLLRIPFVHML
jgi:hypothetical protein